MPDRTVNEELLDEAVRHAHQIESWKKGQARKVGRLVENEILPGLLDRLEQAEQLGAGQQAIRGLIQSMQAIAIAASTRIGQQVIEELTDLAVAESAVAVNQLKKLVPFNLTFNQPSLAILEQLTVQNAVRGQLLDDWFQRLGRRAAEAAESVLRQGLAEGQTVAEMRRALRGTAANRFKDGAINTTRREAEAIVRTSATHVTSQAREATFKANQDIIEEVRWTSTLDTRTTDICISLDGQTFKVGKGPRPPAHINCRSIVVPIVKAWTELGVDPDSVPEATRASMDGQVPADLTYQEWLKTQPESVQNKVLGKAKAELFRKGVPVTKFVDSALKSKTVTQILNEEGLAEDANLGAIRATARRRTKTGRAKGVERVRQAFNKLPESTRIQVEQVASATKSLSGKASGAGSDQAKRVVSRIKRKTRADNKTVERAMATGLLTDWEGIQPPEAPNGQTSIALFDLQIVEKRAVRQASDAIRNILAAEE